MSWAGGQGNRSPDAMGVVPDGGDGQSVCIYNPDLDPGRHGADAIISYITQAITASNQPAHCGRALIRLIWR